MVARRRTPAQRRAAAAEFARSRGNTGGGAVVTGAGRSTTSAGQGAPGSGINRTLHDLYWGTPNSVSGPRTTEYFRGLRYDLGTNPDLLGAAPTGPAPSFGGSGYGRGGGGGGSAMTQAMFDSMMRAIGAQGPQLNLPDFQGQRLAAFNAAPYTQALGQINTAVSADQAAAAAASQQADAALRANYSNAYAAAPVAQAPVAQQVGAGLQATAGGGGDQAAVAAQSNQAAQSDQASFANLLNVLAAADQTTQNSRLNQVALDRGTATRGINAQALGLRGGVNTQRAQAQNQWAQAAAERDYQNSLMRQQWEREEQQGNWQQRNEMISNRLTPLLQLLQGTAGSTVKTDALSQLLAQWSGQPAPKKPAAKPKPALGRG